MLIRHINVNQGQMKVKVELFLTLKELVLKTIAQFHHFENNENFMKFCVLLLPVCCTYYANK